LKSREQELRLGAKPVERYTGRANTEAALASNDKRATRPERVPYPTGGKSPEGRTPRALPARNKAGGYREEETPRRERNPERGTYRARQTRVEFTFDTSGAEGEETP
jgi:hypothetical protein